MREFCQCLAFWSLLLLTYLTVFKCIHSLAPSYQANDYIVHTGHICWWQATPAICQQKKHCCFDGQKLPSLPETFAVSAAVVCNSIRQQLKRWQLSLELRMRSCSVQTFAQRLKKHLLISCYERIWGFSIMHYINVLVIIIIIILTAVDMFLREFTS